MSVWNEFTVRKDQVGGDVLRNVKWRGSLAAYNNRDLLILIHGFNVSQQDANKAFAAFLKCLTSKLGAGRSAELPPAWAFHWPGDHENPILSRLTYSARIQPAQTAGERLGVLLIKLSASRRVILIGHSLGCRVLLQALTYVADRRVSEGTESAQVPVACLLAAAVPVECCTGPGEPYSPEVISNPTYALYSDNDKTLRRYFQAGQRIFGGDVGEAVGRHGGPLGRWADAYDTQLDHDAYWRAAASVDEVARIIRPGLPRARPSRGLPAAALAESWKLRWRQRASRGLGEDLNSAWTDCWPIAGS